MDDLIRRADAINAMGDYLEQLNVSRRYAKSIINKCPSVQQWIPCNKKLPKEADEYLITTKDRHGDTFVKKTMYFPDDELWWDISPFETVTAWMPVPKPYEGEGNV